MKSRRNKWEMYEHGKESDTTKHNSSTWSILLKNRGYNCIYHVINQDNYKCTDECSIHLKYVICIYEINQF